MDDKWFKQQQKKIGVTSHDIAKAMGRSRTNVSKILNGHQRMSMEWAKVFSEVLQVPLDEVLRRAGVLDEPQARRISQGFSEGDAAIWTGKKSEAERIDAIAAALGGGTPGIDVWQMNNDAMVLDGLLAGDYLLADSHQSEMCRAGDVVVAQNYDWKTGSATTLIRRFEPPVLVAASTKPDDKRVLVVDGNNVVIKGKVIASWRI